MILLRASDNGRDQADPRAKTVNLLEGKNVFVSLWMSLQGSLTAQAGDLLRNYRYPSPKGRLGASPGQPPVFSSEFTQLGQKPADHAGVRTNCWNLLHVFALFHQHRARNSKEQIQCVNLHRSLPSWRSSALRLVATRLVNRHSSARPRVQVQLQRLMATSRPAQLLAQAATSLIANPIRNAADLNSRSLLGPITIETPSKPSGFGGFFMPCPSGRGPAGAMTGKGRTCSTRS